jgi:mRNA interferase RelE/StbE
MLEVDVYKRPEKFLRALPPKHSHQVITKIQSLRVNPQPHDSLLLKGHAPLRRADVGEYRVIYFVESQVLHVVLVGRRNDDDVYKQLSRL